jgi:hypothetical protein
MLAAPAALSAPALQCAGVSVTLGRGLHGRIGAHGSGLDTLSVSTFPLAPEPDDVDEVAARSMRRDDVLVLVVVYGSGLASDPAFDRRARVPLTLAQMQTFGQFEGMPRGHVLARRLFVARGAAYDVQVQFARPITPRLAARAASLLRRLRFRRSRPGC